MAGAVEWRCSSPRSRGVDDPSRYIKMLSVVDYTPPGFNRLVLYTPQFCKVPYPGQTLSEPGGLDEQGLLHGELFKSDKWILIDLDILDDTHPLVLYKRLRGALGDGYIMYPTPRGVHIYAVGSLRPSAVEARVMGVRVKIEVKPCSVYTCTSWYRTLNLFKVDGRVFAINGRYLILFDGGGSLEYYEREPEPIDPSILEDRLGVRLSGSIGDVRRAWRHARLLAPEGELRHFASLTPSRRTYTLFKHGLVTGVTVAPDELMSLIDSMYKLGLLPPCLSPVATGEHDNNRFATMVLLVAALSSAGLALDESRVAEYCERLVERWGGSLRQCISKLKSILVCRDGRCVYAYGSSLLGSVAPLWTCDKRRCPIAGCPGPTNPAKAVRHIARYILWHWRRGVSVEAVHGLRL